MHIKAPTKKSSSLPILSKTDGKTEKNGVFEQKIKNLSRQHFIKAHFFHKHTCIWPINLIITFTHPHNLPFKQEKKGKK